MRIFRVSTASPEMQKQIKAYNRGMLHGVIALVLGLYVATRSK